MSTQDECCSTPFSQCVRIVRGLPSFVDLTFHTETPLASFRENGTVYMPVENSRRGTIFYQGITRNWFRPLDLRDDWRIRVDYGDTFVDAVQRRQIVTILVYHTIFIAIFASPTVISQLYKQTCRIRVCCDRSTRVNRGHKLTNALRASCHF